MPPRSGNMNQCNTESCKRCRNKYNCAQYVDYLEAIANSPIVPASEIKNIVSKPEQQPIQINLEPVTAAIQQLSLNIAEMDEKIDMLLTKPQQAEQAEWPRQAENQPDDNASEEVRPGIETETGIVVYNAGEVPLQKGDVYFEQKKTIFGGTKMVEKTVK